MADTRILVVEDEQIVSKDIQARLKRSGYHIAGAAASGEDALRLVKETSPDLVLMDMMLKGDMMGTEAAEKIRDQFGLPVIFLTAYSDADTLERAKKTEAYGYIIKPFEDRELQTAIEMAVYKHHAEQEKQKLKEQLIQAQKLEAIGRLTAGVAHNFNNALHVVMGNLELAHRIAGSDVRPFLERALKASENASDVVQGLAIFSRKNTGHKELFDVRLAVERATDMCRQGLKGEIELVVTPHETPCFVCGDANQIQQVVLNLCINARDAFVSDAFEASFPRIFVAVNQAQIKGADYACILVKDNGIGMTEDIRQHIFEPFFTTKPVGQGTGLGLATAYGIVQNHQGWMDCKSEPKQGTTFVVYLPLVKKEEAQPAQSTTRPVSVFTTHNLPKYSETLLVIDDEEIVRNTARDLLKLYGYRVIEAIDGMSGLSAYQAQKDQIDLVLMDLSMPGMSGQELLKRLVIIDPDVRAIIMTGNMPDDIQISGARAILGKPLMSKELFAVLRRVLDEKN